MSSASSEDRDASPEASSPVDTEASNPQEYKGDKIILGIAAMDRKARSKPMRNILSRLLLTGKFETIVFGDKMILDEDVEKWPICEYLISFFSSGFPLDKAIRYVQLRKPRCINDLPMQKVFWDRRVVLAILDAIGVRTPERIEVDRDGGPRIDKAVADMIEKELKIRVDEPRPYPAFKITDNGIDVGGRAMKKPFVEKPVSGEDHNINIYFGSGGRRLFRKIDNKSSEWDAGLTQVRTDGSYVYEKFMKVDNPEDIKVYTLGPQFVHAEVRKSPVVDGVVRRNPEGKEIRYVTHLTEEEKRMAKDIAKHFKQNICGFDLLRAGGKSYVIDVNGWSFVKGNDFYYDKCAEILYNFCRPSIPKQIKEAHSPREKTWRLKESTCVFRHADRTPKSKLKFNFKGKDSWVEPFVALLQGRRDEIILRKREQLQFISDAATKSLEIEGADKEKLEQLIRVIKEKSTLPGTKAQLKPSFDEETDICEKVNVIVKWGGEFTHAAGYQSRDAGENCRKDFMIMNDTILQHTTIYTSSERRVMATAEVFSTALLLDRKSRLPREHTHELIIRKDLLDDSNAAKEPMDEVKKKLKTILRPGMCPHANLPSDVNPQDIVNETIALMRYHRDVFRQNWESRDTKELDLIQKRWCCGEWPFLFKERWDKLFTDFCDVEPEKFDPSRVSELYDSLKHDALHNRTFLETLFTPRRASHDKSDSPPEKLRELYRSSKILFDLIASREYGMDKAERIEIGLLTSLPLLQKILQDLAAAKDIKDGCANFYFTKESHIQTLVNLIVLSDLPIVMPHTPELDYMSCIAFEVWERLDVDRKEFSLRISMSSGAHSAPLDASLDAKHALQVIPRRLITNHIPLDEAIETLSRYSDHAGLKKSTTPFEGMLPLEGDELFNGKPSLNVEIVNFKPERPHSVASSMEDNVSLDGL